MDAHADPTGLDRGGVDRAGIDRAGLELPETVVARFAEQVVAEVSTRRATWTTPNVLAEAARVTRALRVPDPQARMVLLDRVVASALERCVALDPPLAATTAQRYLHPSAAVSAPAAGAPVADGAAVRAVADTGAVFTTWEVLAAEARLLGAHADITAPVGHPEACAVAARPMPGWMSSSPDQVYAAGAIVGSGRRVDVLVGPAGAGKTATLHVVRGGWELTYGPGSVIGLAPSATAAAQLALALRIPADTVAKWLHESTPTTPANAASASTANPAIQAGPAVPALWDSGGGGGRSWRFRAGQLVLIDEAAMVATADLDQIVTQASAAGAKVVLVGDYAQLGAIDAGGAFALLAGEGHALELDQLHRFSQEWEAPATRQLRIGDLACLDTYAAHGRLHDGPAEAMLEAAYRAWKADLAAGRHSLLLAGDHATVNALNQRARGDRIRDGRVDPRIEVSLNDGTTAGPGDVVLTRRNQRRLTRPEGGCVRNGDCWQVTVVHPDGALDVTPANSASSDGPSGDAVVRLPADYVRDHLELGYALTVHRAQGTTADTTHLITDTRMSREALYVGLTRGRHANHAYITTDSPATEAHGINVDPTVRQVLEAILRSSAADSSATAVLRQREADHILALSRAGQWPPELAAVTDELGWSHSAPERPPPAYGISR